MSMNLMLCPQSNFRFSAKLRDFVRFASSRFVETVHIDIMTYSFGCIQAAPFQISNAYSVSHGLVLFQALHFRCNAMLTRCLTIAIYQLIQCGLHFKLFDF